MVYKELLLSVKEPSEGTKSKVNFENAKKLLFTKYPVEQMSITKSGMMF